MNKQNWLQNSNTAARYQISSSWGTVPQGESLISGAFAVFERNYDIKSDLIYQPIWIIMVCLNLPVDYFGN